MDRAARSRVCSTETTLLSSSARPFVNTFGAAAITKKGLDACARWQRLAARGSTGPTAGEQVAALAAFAIRPSAGNGISCMTALSIHPFAGYAVAHLGPPSKAAAANPTRFRSHSPPACPSRPQAPPLQSQIPCPSLRIGICDCGLRASRGSSGWRTKPTSSCCERSARAHAICSAPGHALLAQIANGRSQMGQEGDREQPWVPEVCQPRARARKHASE